MFAGAKLSVPSLSHSLPFDGFNQRKDRLYRHRRPHVGFRRLLIFEVASFIVIIIVTIVANHFKDTIDYFKD